MMATRFLLLVTLLLRGPELVISFTTSLHGSFSTRLSASTERLPVLVLSPPGGIGEVAAANAAALGSDVRWFVISQTGDSPVILSRETLATIDASGGSLSVSSADANSLVPFDAKSTTVEAIKSLTGSASSLVCALDGCDDPNWRNAILLAAREAARSVPGTRIAVVSASEDDEEQDDKEEQGGIGGIVKKLVPAAGTEPPSSLRSALAADGKLSSVITLRHGVLFGSPDSSPDFSPMVGGPRRDVELCEVWQRRDIRIDPTISMSGNKMMGTSTKTSRLAIGEAAALLACGIVPVRDDLDICVSSLPGSDPMTVERWSEEFQRLDAAFESDSAAQLFDVEFADVPDVERLADWLAVKWAPAVLRTYDIATIRSGARPVYATRTGACVEVVWQELAGFDTVTTGKMLIEVSNTGLTASRGVGDASAGFGTVSRKPLPGEDVLVRRLTEAAAQAVEKGLAEKVSSLIEELWTPLTQHCRLRVKQSQQCQKKYQ